MSSNTLGLTIAIAMDRSLAILLANLALVAVLLFLRRRASKDPRRSWVYLFYGVEIGPRTDTKCMTKGELLDSGVRFIVWGLIFSSLVLAFVPLSSLVFPAGDLPGAVFLVGFFLVLFAGMGFVGGLYLLIRGLLRRADDTPSSRREV